MKHLLIAFMAASAIRSTMGQCVNRLNDLEALESNVPDYNVPREYTLCPRQIYRVGKLDISYNIGSSLGTNGIKLRPNVHIKCHETGSSEDNCVIKDGDIQIDASNLFGALGPVTNVTLQGLTFIETTKYSLYGNKPGDITFLDCVFRKTQTAEAIILADYFKPQENNMLELNFIDCFFNGNRFYGKPAYPAIINANGAQNKIVVASSQFKDNDMVFNNTESATLSFLIETSGPLELYDNCFENNQVGFSNVVSWYKDTPTTFDNFGDNSMGGSCSYLASYETDQQYKARTPRCLLFDAARCKAFATDSPSSSPSSSPTTTPTASPSDAPSASPSAAPTISMAPSVSPSVSPAPSSSPSDKPSASPTASPTKSPAPSERPSDLPSANPTTTPYPTSSPTISAQPSSAPSSTPTESPTGAPTPESGATMLNVGKMVVLSVGLIVATMAGM